MTTQSNLYDAPRFYNTLEDRSADPVILRRAHLRHEGAVAGVGWLLVMGGVMLIVIGGAALLPSESVPMDFATRAMVTGFSVAWGGLKLGAGLAMVFRSPVAKILVPVNMLLTCLSIPTGPLMGGYALWLVFSEKGASIFSGDYTAVVRATPTLRPIRSLFGWFALLGVVPFGMSLICVVLAALVNMFSWL